MALAVCTILLLILLSLFFCPSSYSLPFPLERPGASGKHPASSSPGLSAQLSFLFFSILTFALSDARRPHKKRAHDPPSRPPQAQTSRNPKASVRRFKGSVV